MAAEKRPPPTAEQIQRIRDGWSVRLLDVRSIAEETGLHRATVLAEIRRRSWWSEQRVRRQKARDEKLAALGEECTRRQMEAALALAGAWAVGAEKAERAMAEASDLQALGSLRRLPSLRDVQVVERVNTNRPVVGPAPGQAQGEDRTKSILERLLDRAGEGQVPTAPFPGEEGERPEADPTKGDL